jgi:hypothetical protein
MAQERVQISDVRQVIHGAVSMSGLLEKMA